MMYVHQLIEDKRRNGRFRAAVEGAYAERRGKQTSAANEAWRLAASALSRRTPIEDLARKNLFAVRALFFEAAKVHDPSLTGRDWAKDIWADYLHYRKLYGFA